MRLVRYSYPAYRNTSPSAVFSRTPWFGLESEVERLFNGVNENSTAPSIEGSFPVDLYQDKENSYIKAELPGVNRDALSLEVADGVLTIQATRTRGEGDTAQKDTFKRAVTLSDDVQSETVRATYENGVLTITLPKKEAVKPKKIAIQVA